MGLITSKCSICGATFRSRNKANHIKKIGKHWRKRHPNALSQRIKRGKRSSLDNPSVQDFVSALQDSPRAAIEIYRDWTEKQYQNTKKIMDALEPVLPTEVVVAWKTVEAVHDYQKG